MSDYLKVAAYLRQAVEALDDVLRSPHGIAQREVLTERAAAAKVAEHPAFDAPMPDEVKAHRDASVAAIARFMANRNGEDVASKVTSDLEAIRKQPNALVSLFADPAELRSAVEAYVEQQVSTWSDAQAQAFLAARGTASTPSENEANRSGTTAAHKQVDATVSVLDPIVAHIVRRDVNRAYTASLLNAVAASQKARLDLFDASLPVKRKDYSDVIEKHAGEILRLGRGVMDVLEEPESVDPTGVNSACAKVEQWWQAIPHLTEAELAAAKKRIGKGKLFDEQTGAVNSRVFLAAVQSPRTQALLEHMEPVIAGIVACQTVQAIIH